MAYKAPPGKGYADVAAVYRARIQAGELAAGASLPSVAEIREEFGVSAKTVSRALGVLKGEGLVASRGSLGSVVAESPIVITGADRVDRMAKNGKRYAPGETSTGHTVMYRSVRNPEECQTLDLEPGDEVLIRIRTFRQNDRPTTVGISLYPPRTVSVVPELAEEGPMAVGFFGDLFTERTGRAVTKGQRTFSARQAGPEELERLEITTPSYTSVSVPVATVVFHDEEGPLAYWEDIYAPGSKVPVT